MNGVYTWKSKYQFISYFRIWFLDFRGLWELFLCALLVLFVGGNGRYFKNVFRGFKLNWFPYFSAFLGWLGMVYFIDILIYLDRKKNSITLNIYGNFYLQNSNMYCKTKKMIETSLENHKSLFPRKRKTKMTKDNVPKLFFYLKLISNNRTDRKFTAVITLSILLI